MDTLCCTVLCRRDRIEVERRGGDELSFGGCWCC